MDVGIYFPQRPSITVKAIHNNIVSALQDHTDESPTIKNKCVRIYYSNQFHIDLPVYFYVRGKYYLGTATEGWKMDDPKLFTDWLKENTEDNPQKIRVIKYFKAWVDVVKKRSGQRMPSGLALSIWIIKYYEQDVREDVAFFKTAITLRNYLKDTSQQDWECRMPTGPGDDVILKLNSEQRNNFLKALNSLIEESTAILALSSKEKCIASWKTILGKWFE